MSPYRRFLETLHLTAAGLWLGAVAMTGAAAAIIFPTMRDLDPTLPAYEAFTGPHWRLAAGQVASKLFFIADAVQLGCIIICGLTLGIIALAADAWRRPIAMALRLIALFAAVGLMTYSFARLGPRMNSNMYAYWAAAQAGDTETALIHQEAFDQDHPTASRVMVGSLACALVLMTAGAFSATGAGGGRPIRNDRASQDSTAPKRTLETPSLARGGGRS